MCKVRVPQAVFDGLEIVRKSGLTNMLDRPVVADLAQEFGYYETADWVKTHRDKYARGLFQGFQAT